MNLGIAATLLVSARAGHLPCAETVEGFTGGLTFPLYCEPEQADGASSADGSGTVGSHHNHTSVTTGDIYFMPSDPALYQHGTYTGDALLCSEACALPCQEANTYPLYCSYAQAATQSPQDEGAHMHGDYFMPTDGTAGLYQHGTYSGNAPQCVDACAGHEDVPCKAVVSDFDAGFTYPLYCTSEGATAASPDSDFHIHDTFFMPTDATGALYEHGSYIGFAPDCNYVCEIPCETTDDCLDPFTCESTARRGRKLRMGHSNTGVCTQPSA